MNNNKRALKKIGKAQGLCQLFKSFFKEIKKSPHLLSFYRSEGAVDTKVLEMKYAYFMAHHMG